MRNTSLIALLGMLALLAGCAGRAEFESQTISTPNAVRIDLGLSDRTTIRMLVGARDADAPDQAPPTARPKLIARSAQAAPRAAARTTFSDAETGFADPAPIVESGWIYILRPPAWPIVRTPATRGGVPVGMQWDGTTQIAAAVEGGIERIFFLGAFNDDGSPRPETVRLRVDDFPTHVSNPDAVELRVGEYAEARINNGVLELIVGAHPVTDLQCPQEIRELLLQIRQHAEENGLPWNPAMDIPSGPSSGS